MQIPEGKELDRVGRFRGKILSYNLNAAKSGAKSVFMIVEIDEIHQDGEWFDWREYGMQVSGDVWIIKKDGTLNGNQVRALTDHAGWDGDIVAISNGSWQPTPVQITAEENEYNGHTSYRIQWINAYDSEPSGGNVSLDDATAMAAKFGSQLRAIAGNGARNSAPPAGAPETPKPKATTPTPPSSPAVAEADEIPF